MALYTIADLHLSEAVYKPMDKFGARWQSHRDKLEKRWNALVSDNDTVVIPGDISWAMTLEGAQADMRFISSLNGKKLLGKGNHDYWWDSESKMKAMLESSGIEGISFLHNNAYLIEGLVICGSRGWFVEEGFQVLPREKRPDYNKLIARECIRLTCSLTEGKKLAEREGITESPTVFLHFPPVYGSFVCEELIDVMLSFGVKRCYYGHIHNNYSMPQTCVYRGISFTLISSDYLDFYPYPVR